MKRLTLITVLAAQCIGAQLACADSTPPTSRTQVSVHFDDLNLAQTQDVATLYKRLRVAADDACSLPDELPLQRGRRFQACVAGALSAAVARLDQPRLTAYYRTQLDGGKT